MASNGGFCLVSSLDLIEVWRSKNINLLTVIVIYII